MAKKRKVSGRQSKELKALDVKDGKLRPIRSYEDVADSEDEFHINRDKILLDDGPDAKRRKKWEDEDALVEPSDEEILGYSTLESDEGDLEDNEANNGVGAKPEDDPDPGALEEDEEDAGGWGSSKRDYYNADNIETEVDALEEEAEAKRLQQKKLQKMSEADFGFDENEWLDAENVDNDEDVLTEVLKDVEITADMDSEERLNLLRTRYPEFESLANEFLKLQPLFDNLQLEAKAVVGPGSSSKAGTRLALTKLRALAAYLGALTMYFAVFTSTAKTFKGSSTAFAPIELHDHNVMESLLHCRELWSKVMNLKPTLDKEPGGDLITAEVDILENEGELTPTTRTQEPESKKHRKEQARELVAAEIKRARAERIHAAEAELHDLDLLLPKSKKLFKPPAVKSIAKSAGSDSDFGEEESLSTRALAEKAARKKSLRFYTSQITQKANRRADAGRDAGGDADLPYRERLRDRQVRLNAEAEKRGKKLDEYGRGTALGGDDSGVDDADAEVVNAIRGEEDDYYDMIAQVSRRKKSDKAERYAAIAAAKAVGKTVRVVEGEVGEDGKRAIGHMIQKNKGLASKRKKEVRNPRVKRRKMFEGKMKKLATIKAVYKGGEGKGGYGGEKTGIKTELVKSVKL